MLINKLIGTNYSNNVEKVELDDGTVLDDPTDISQTINFYVISVKSDQQQV